MRKILTFLFGLYCTIIFGQTVSINEQINVNAALNVHQIGNPDMNSFQKVNHIPMNSYTGRAQVTIPIYQITSGDISVPISISYNTSGVKVNDVPSSIGSNWSLSAGGSISKTVKGVEDFYYKAEKFTTDVSNTFSNYTIKSLGWLHHSDYKANPSLNDLLGETSPFQLPDGTGGIYTNGWEDTVTDNDDYRPDLFTASAPGLQSSFVHRKDKTPMEINNVGNTIISSFGESELIDFFGFNDEWEGRRRIKCINKISIINPQGTTYTFKDLDISQSADIIANKSYNRKQKNDFYSYSQVNSYHLSSIKSAATLKNVSFEYDKYSLSNDEGKLVDSYKLWGRDLTNIPLENPLVINEQFFINKHPQLNRLNKIRFDEGSVEFIYAKERLDLIGEQALVFIKIKDYHEKTIKTFKFEYDYFIADTNCNGPECKRLKLLRIRIFGKDGNEIPGYEFSYNEKKLPKRNAFNQDFLGYANATTSNLIGGAPKLFFAPNKGRLSLFPVSLGTEYRELPGVYSMKANLEYTRAGILNSIKYPTGASTEFAYELNSFLLNGKEIKGAGLRLKSQRIIDETGEQQILDYKYVDSDGKTSGRINAIPLFGKAKLGPWGAFNGDISKVNFDIYTSSQSQAELTDGAFVGYSRVLIKNRENHGVTEQIYSSSKDQPDLVAPLVEIKDDGLETINTEITSYQVDFSNKAGEFHDLPIDQGIFRGKLKVQRLYNSSGNLVAKKEISYTNDKYSTIPLNYVREEKDIVDNGDGPSRTRKYLQHITLESQRYLMTSEESTEYFENGNKTTTKTDQKYHTKFPFLKEQSGTNSFGENIKNIFHYPDEKSILADLSTNESLAIDKLINSNQYAIPIQTESYVDNQKTYTKRTAFKDWGNTIIAPSLQKTAKGVSTLEDRILYKGYHNNGNLKSLSQNDGTEISYLYGYNKSVPIAELKNVQYTAIPDATISALETLSNADNSVAAEQQLRVALDELRGLFPNGQITTYTYDPLIGITSITDPRGERIFYYYDEFNRLKTIKDHNQKILKEYCYGYRGDSNPCGSDLVAPNGMYIQLGNPKTYNIPIPNPLTVPEYSWDGIEINNEYNYKSLHPILFFPRPRNIHDQEPNVRTEPISDEYNLPYPNEFYSSGWEAKRTGVSFKLVGLDSNTTSDYILKWGILIDGTKLPLSGKIPELSNVIFPTKCLNGVQGQIYCEVINIQNASRTYTIESTPIVFHEGMINNDNHAGAVDLLSSQSSNYNEFCELIDSINVSDNTTDNTTNPGTDWEDTNWDVVLDPDPDVVTDPGGDPIPNGPIQLKIAPYKKYQIPIPNDFSVAEYSWSENPNARKSLHPVFYFSRPQIPDNPPDTNVTPINTAGLTLPYPASYYSSGWLAERGGYQFSVEGLNTLDTPYTIEWLFKIGNEEQRLGAIIPETDNIFFVPASLKNKQGRILCRIHKNSLGSPSETIDIEGPVMTFQEGLYPEDNQHFFGLLTQ